MNEKSDEKKKVKKTSHRRGREKTKNKSNVKHNFKHPWLTCSVSSPGTPILDMALTVNNKYLMTCADGKYSSFTNDHPYCFLFNTC